MRIIKLSKKVFGFDSLRGCQAFFTHVLPWGKYTFDIAGEGAHIAPDGLAEEELVVFSYDGILVCIAKAKQIISENNKVKSIKLADGTLKVLENPPRLQELEDKLHAAGYMKNLVGTQGWNILDGRFENEAVKFLRNKDWEIYVK